MSQIKYIHVDRWNVAYYQENTGKPVVLFMHGFTSDMNAIMQLKQFDRNYDLVAVDYPLHGRTNFATEDRRAPSGYEFYEFLSSFIRHLNIKIDVIVAHSFGAVGTLGALQNGLAKKAIFLTPFTYLFLENKKLAELNSWLMPSSLEDAIASLSNLSAKNSPQYLKSIPLFASRMFANIDIRKSRYGQIFSDMNSIRFNDLIHEQYIQNASKILLVAGEKDLYVSKESLEKISKDLHIDLIVVPDAGHAIMMDQPQLISDIIIDQVAKVNESK